MLLGFNGLVVGHIVPPPPPPPQKKKKEEKKKEMEVSRWRPFEPTPEKVPSKNTRICQGQQTAPGVQALATGHSRRKDLRVLFVLVSIVGCLFVVAVCSFARLIERSVLPHINIKLDM